MERWMKQRGGSFQQCKDWNSLFSDARSSSSHPFTTLPPPSRPSSRQPPPELSRPPTAEHPARRHMMKSASWNGRASKQGFGAPPPTPTRRADFDPAMHELKKQWSWGFQPRANRAKTVVCLNCDQDIFSDDLDAHLLLCSPSRPLFSKPEKSKCTCFHRGKCKRCRETAKEGKQQDPRHDREYVAPQHKQPWKGVIDEEDEEDGARTGRTRATLNLVYGGGPGGSFRSERRGVWLGGALGPDAARKLAEDKDGAESKSERTCDDLRGSRSGGSGSERGAGRAAKFWEEHARRMERENATWDTAFDSFKNAKKEREKEAEQRAAREEERRREEREEREKEEARRKEEERRKAALEQELRKKAGEYDAVYQVFEGRAKGRSEVTYTSIPWPSAGGGVANLIPFVTNGLPGEEARKVIKNWSRRWHPDTWGRYRLAESDRERIMARVHEISKKINAYL